MLSVLLGGVFLGISADLMLREVWGLNILLFVIALAAMMFFHRRKESRLDAHSISVLVVLVAASSTFVWRDADEIKILAVLTMLMSLAALTFQRLGITGHLAGFFHYVVGLVFSGLSSILGPLVFLNRDFRSDDSKASRNVGVMFAAIKGVAISVPLLIIFIGLFSSADPRFEAMVDWLITLPGVELTLEHGLTIGIVSWFFYGYLRGSSPAFSAGGGRSEVFETYELEGSEGGKVLRLFRAAVSDVRAKFDVMNFENSMLPRAFTLGVVEIAVIFGLLTALFLVFVGFQIEYLFGGFEFVQRSVDMKLADYARSGFGELVAVSFLVLPLVLVTHWLVRKDERNTQRVFRVLSFSLITLLFVIMVSAIQRFVILTGDLGYGFTSPRFYALVFILWLAFIFVWFIGTVLTGRRSRFALGMFWSAVVFFFGVNVINPDAFIIRQNLSLMEKGREFDGSYPGVLGHDAVPILVEAYPRLNEIQKCEVHRVLSQRSKQLSSSESWLSWNLARQSAKDSLSSKESPLSGPPPQCVASAPEAKSRE